ncbi:MAG: tripartite tricarboxylate transporter TctB family protein [Geminicoccaceae bacterium]|nr:tripartite tricarboxylate transporter TctB family protein [Geminicoccaceae bacterium]
MPFRAFAYDWIVWVLFLVLPLVIFWQCATSLEAQGVTSGGPMENAAIFPRIVAWVLIGLAVLNGARIAMGVFSQPSPFEPTDTTRLALAATALFVSYLLVLPLLGYHIATPILMAVLFNRLGLGVLKSVAGGLAASLSVAGVFQGLLNVVLPVGMFDVTIFG